MKRLLQHAGQLCAISRGLWMAVIGLILAAPAIAQTGTSPWENAVSVLQQGERLFPRKWNDEFIDMPMVEKSKQNTPHFTSEVIAGILARTKGYKQMFCALLAGTGLRAGGSHWA